MPKHRTSRLTELAEYGTRWRHGDSTEETSAPSEEASGDAEAMPVSLYHYNKFWNVTRKL